MKPLTACLFCILFFASCFSFRRNDLVEPEQQKIFGSKPVYTADTGYRIVTYTATAQPVTNAGKIYVKGNRIYQCETGKGIHIIDNSIPATAKRIAFITVQGCEEIAIKDNFLYTNNYYDLVTLDISIPAQVKVVARNKDAFYSASSMTHTWEMPDVPGYFECPQFYTDSVISGWIQDSIYMSCYK